jgi:AGCS family alanine or glycine:cation symporter
MCTLTALIILISGVWQVSDSSGVTLTSEAFSTILGPIGSLILFVCVVSFGMSTIFTYSYYGASCAKFLFGEAGNRIYQYIFIIFVGIFSVTSLDFALNVVDGSFAMMAIPTLLSTIWLAPKVVKKANEYFTSLDQDKKVSNQV